MSNEVLDYLRVFVWPGVVTGIVIIFRRQFRALLGRLTDVTTPWGSARFGERVAHLAERADEARTALAPSLADEGLLPLPLGRPGESFHAPDVVDPTLAFLDAYRGLEAAARDAAGTLGINQTLPYPIARYLVNREVVPNDVGSIAAQLRSIRNEVVHGARRLAPADAQNLITASRSLGDVLLAGAEKTKAQGREGPR